MVFIRVILLIILIVATGLQALTFAFVPLKELTKANLTYATVCLCVLIVRYIQDIISIAREK